MLKVPRLHEHKRTCEREQRQLVRGLEKENGNMGGGWNLRRELELREWDRKRVRGQNLGS